MLELIINSLLLGAALAIDAFSVSVADGLSEPGMRKRKALLIAGTFGFFQFLMPLIGYALIRTVENWFEAAVKAVPYIALVLLVFLGINTIRSGKEQKKEDKKVSITVKAVLLQGVATSIDALSAGLSFSTQDIPQALIASLIIGVVTFALCVIALTAGKKIGPALSGRAHIAGGVILILIGIEIFVKSFF